MLARHWLTLLALAALCLAQSTIGGQDAPPAEDAPEVRSFSDEELSAARATIDTLTPDQTVLLNAVRYLLRPEYEEDLMRGRRYQPAALQPFESAPGLSSEAEMLRLLVVLQSGMPLTDALTRAMSIFLSAPVPGDLNSLAPFAIRLMICREALRRPEIGFEARLRATAEVLVKAAAEHVSLAGRRSPHIVDNRLTPRWYASHLWRSVICRVALELEVEFDQRAWENDLRDLAGQTDRNRGWAESAVAIGDLSNDLTINLTAMAALSIALAVPDNAMRENRVRPIERGMRTAPQVLARLQQEFQPSQASGPRWLLIATLPETLGPDGLDAEEWRRGLKEAIDPQLSGAITRTDMLLDCLDLTRRETTGEETMALETALAALGLSGGLLPDKPGPLASMELPAIGRALHAMSVLHAAAMPPRTFSGIESLSDAAEAAIQAGCHWLRTMQLPDGSFPGFNDAYSGNTAIALLTLLYGGTDRNSEHVQRGLKWLLAYDAGRVPRGRARAGVAYDNTYSDALTLMFLQKYYEPEQMAARMFTASDPTEYREARRRVWDGIPAAHRTLINQLVRKLDGAHAASNRGWGYYARPGQMPHGSYGNHRGYADNSASQYAVLGYKAASLLGADIDASKLLQEAERLMSTYQPDRDMEMISYEFPPDPNSRTQARRNVMRIHPGGWSYTSTAPSGMSMHNPPNLQMTAAGVSSLVICADELQLRGRLSERLAERIALTIHGAQAYMGHLYYTADEPDGRRNPRSLDHALGMSHGDGWGAYYNLYSVERAAVLAGLQLIGGVDWYTIGATKLIQHQRDDGHWGAPRMRGQRTSTDVPLVNTCMAILFLKLASPPVITDPQRRGPPEGPITGDRKGPVTGERQNPEAEQEPKGEAEDEAEDE